jgi:hypothetical protein
VIKEGGFYVEISEGWQPIETAPKDGTRILAFIIEPEIVEYEPEYGQWLDYSSEVVSPTHWQPLPDAPNNEAGERK